VKNLDIFFSHASEDKILAGAIVRLLRNSFPDQSLSIRCTSVADARPQTGDIFAETVMPEVRDATVFVLLVTPSAVKKPAVIAELTARRAHSKDVLPIGPIPSVSLPWPHPQIQATDCKSIAELAAFLVLIRDRLGFQNLEPCAALRECVADMASLVLDLDKKCRRRIKETEDYFDALLNRSDEF
jgi:hypothetical protein